VLYLFLLAFVDNGEIACAGVRGCDVKRDGRTRRVLVQGGRLSKQMTLHGRFSVEWGSTIVCWRMGNL